MFIRYSILLCLKKLINEQPSFDRGRALCGCAPLFPAGLLDRACEQGAKGKVVGVMVSREVLKDNIPHRNIGCAWPYSCQLHGYLATRAAALSPWTQKPQPLSPHQKPRLELRPVACAQSANTFAPWQMISRSESTQLATRVSMAL